MLAVDRSAARSRLGEARVRAVRVGRGELADLLHHPNQEDLLDAERWQRFLDRYLPYRIADPGFGERLPSNRSIRGGLDRA